MLRSWRRGIIPPSPPQTTGMSWETQSTYPVGSSNLTGRMLSGSMVKRQLTSGPGTVPASVTVPLVTTGSFSISPEVS